MTRFAFVSDSKAAPNVSVVASAFPLRLVEAKIAPASPSFTALATATVSAPSLPASWSVPVKDAQREGVEPSVFWEISPVASLPNAALSCVMTEFKRLVV